MEQKIFKKSNSRRMEFNISSNLQPFYWWLRSRSVDRKFYHYLGYVDFINHIRSLGSDCYASILPACTI